MTEEHIYIDTVYIHSYLLGRGNEEAHAAEQVKKALRMANRSKNICVIFPFVVIGELMNSIWRESISAADKKTAIGEFIDVLAKKRVDLKPPEAKSMKVAVDIKSEDSRLDDTDLLITAQALCDIHSTNLLTNDPNLIISEKIYEYEQSIKGRINRLKISEDIA